MKEYSIIDATIKVENQTIIKQNIVYYDNENPEGVVEFYSKNGVVMVEIRPGYTERK